MAKLTSTEITNALAKVPEWRHEALRITRTFAFKDFVSAIKFVNRIAAIAEKAGHHPDIDIRWNKVTLALTTHDEGGLTEKDFRVAGQCDRTA